MREREKEVATGFGNGPDRTDCLQKNGCLVSKVQRPRAKRTMCVVVVVDDLCVVLVLPDMHRQSRWTVISFGLRQVRMGENIRRGAP